MGYRDVIVADRVRYAWPLTESASPPINIVQSTSGHNANTTAGGPFTVSATLSNTPSAANQLIAIIGSYETCTAVSVNALAWTTDKISPSAGLAVTAVLRVQSDGSTTAFTFTLTHSTSVSADIWVYLMEVSGLAASPVDQSTSGDVGAATSTGTVSLTADAASNELVIYAVTAEASTQPTAPTFTGSITSLFTGDTGSTATDKTSLFVGSYIATAAYTPTSVMGWTTSANCGYVAISYKGTAAPVSAQSITGEVAGGNNVLTWGGGPTLGQKGIYDNDGDGGSVLFAAASSQYGITASSLTTMTPANQLYSLEGWLNFTATTANMQPLTLNDSTENDNGIGLYIRLNVATAGVITVYYCATGGSSFSSISSPNSYNDGKWHHVVALMNGNIVQLWVDGINVVSGSGTGPSSGTAMTMWVGADYNGSAEVLFYSGSVAWPACYEHALSPAQIIKHYLTGIGTWARGDHGRRRRR